MKIIHAAAELDSGSRPVCLAIGVFDGVHLGHQQVVRRAVADASRHGGHSVVITFDRHPAAVLAPDRVPPMIYPLSKKLDVVAALGADTALVIHFDKMFSRIPGDEFIRGLTRDFGTIQSISVGDAFVFGRGRTGDVALLQALGPSLRFVVHAVPEVLLDGLPVSSTRVREAVREGSFDLASRLLGRPYALCGKVAEGAGLGRRIGVPTANLDAAGMVLPPSGVYAARAAFGCETRRAAVNIGRRPTVGSAAPQIHVEAHLIDFDGDLYGQDLELVILRKLREEQKFASLEALREQIVKDIAAAREAS